MQQNELHAHVKEGWQEMNHQEWFFAWEGLWRKKKKQGLSSHVLPWSQALQVPTSHVEIAEPCSHCTALAAFSQVRNYFTF